jgi:hypothetical protein
MSTLVGEAAKDKGKGKNILVVITNSSFKSLVVDKQSCNKTLYNV